MCFSVIFGFWGLNRQRMAHWESSWSVSRDTVTPSHWLFGQTRRLFTGQSIVSANCNHNQHTHTQMNESSRTFCSVGEFGKCGRMQTHTDLYISASHPKQVNLCVGVHINKNTCTRLQTTLCAAQNVQILFEHVLLQYVRSPAWPPLELCLYQMNIQFHNLHSMPIFDAKCRK